MALIEAEDVVVGLDMLVFTLSFGKSEDRMYTPRPRPISPGALSY